MSDTSPFGALLCSLFGLQLLYEKAFLAQTGAPSVAVAPTWAGYDLAVDHWTYCCFSEALACTELPCQGKVTSIAATYAEIYPKILLVSSLPNET